MIKRDPGFRDEIDKLAEYAKSLEGKTTPELLLELQQNALQLLRLHEIQGPPSAELTTIRINLTDYEPRIPKIPSDTLAQTPHFDELITTMDVNNVTNQAGMYIQLIGMLHTGVRVTLDTTTTDSESPLSTSISIGEGENTLTFPIDCKKSDINQLLASIFLPNKTGNYTPFQRLDINNPVIVNNIAESLSKRAKEVVSRGVYSTDTERLEYTVRNGDVREVIYDSPSQEGVAFTVQVTPTALSIEAILSNEYAIDGVEYYSADTRQPLPQQSTEELLHQCVVLYEKMLDLNITPQALPIISALDADSDSAQLL